MFKLPASQHRISSIERKYMHHNITLILQELKLRGKANELAMVLSSPNIHRFNV